ncbi:MAG: uncharacterized ferritin-like protein (DUF455 family) [Gammaproteobacteria bacterium]|jgi:uncharacterized ferritin-like protein (DUF455 family)
MDNLFSLAFRCLSEPRLDEKLTLSELAAKNILSGSIEVSPSDEDIKLIKVGRPDQPLLVDPRNLPRRSMQNNEGRAAMIHSIAHIEFNAINLAWDLICRFQDMPDDFYFDWTKVAAEETRHFQLLQSQLRTLGYEYGDFPAHNGLWDIAEQSAHDLLLRLAVVPRILEARGLDVTPGLISRFRQIKDESTCSILELILEEEIGHVKTGTKWYRYQCEKLNLEPEEKFKQIAKEYMPSNNTNKINIEARLMAGFSQSELDFLVLN